MRIWTVFPLDLGTSRFCGIEFSLVMALLIWEQMMRLGLLLFLKSSDVRLNRSCRIRLWCSFSPCRKKLACVERRISTAPRGVSEMELSSTMHSKRVLLSPKVQHMRHLMSRLLD